MLFASVKDASVGEKLWLDHFYKSLKAALHVKNYSAESSDGDLTQAHKSIKFGFTLWSFNNFHILNLVFTSIQETYLTSNQMNFTFYILWNNTTSVLINVQNKLLGQLPD